MRAFLAFTKKEWVELIRTGRLAILLVLFSLFGIMNPAIAKLTPWMMETMADSLKKTGLTVAAVKVDAMTSWMQFYKNIPIAMVIFLLMFGGILTAEYQKGTLINMLTKGLARWKVILAKCFIMTATWTVCYWLCYGITYGYNWYFWENGIASHLGFAAACVWMLGIWLIAVILLMSTVFQTSSAVLAATGGIVAVSYAIGLIPKARKFLPTHLLEASGMLSGAGSIEEYWCTVWITIGLGVVGVLAAVLAYSKK